MEPGIVSVRYDVEIVGTFADTDVRKILYRIASKTSLKAFRVFIEHERTKIYSRHIILFRSSKLIDTSEILAVVQAAAIALVLVLVSSGVPSNS